MAGPLRQLLKEWSGESVGSGGGGEALRTGLMAVLDGADKAAAADAEESERLKVLLTGVARALVAVLLERIAQGSPYAALGGTFQSPRPTSSASRGIMLFAQLAVLISSDGANSAGRKVGVRPCLEVHGCHAR